jgi:SAM-dependent methyltransferase
VKSQYDNRIHGDYYPPASVHHVPSRYRSIVEHGRPLLKGGEIRVLEIGAEIPEIPQFWIRALGLLPGQVAIGDISTRSVELLQAAGLSAFQVDVSTNLLPFPDESFNLVIMSEVIEHLVNTDAALDEVRRVLRLKGGLVLTTPNLAGWINRIQLGLGRQPIGTETGTEWVFGRGPFIQPSRPVGHFQLLTVPALLALVRHHGLLPTRIGGMPFSEGIPHMKGLRTIDRLFSRFPSLASCLILTAVKIQTARTTKIP